MSAGQGNAGPGASRLAAGEDRADRSHRQPVERHGDQRQRKQRRGAHRIDVRQRVGCGDGAEVEWVIDDRHEKIGRGDNRLAVVEPIDGGIVRRFDADQQLFRQQARRRFGDQLPQHPRGDLAAATTAMTEFGQAERREQRWCPCQSYVFDNPSIRRSHRHSNRTTDRRRARAAIGASDAALENYRRKRQSKRAADGIRRPEAWSCRAELPCPFAAGAAFRYPTAGGSRQVRRCDRENASGKVPWPDEEFF